MAYSRSSVLVGQNILLRTVITDDAGNLVDTDDLPDVYIYDSTVESDTIDSEIEAATFSSALAGPLVPTRIDTGFYEYTYTVPSNGEEGGWRDVWVGEVEGEPVSEVLVFNVDVGATISIQPLSNNELVTIELSAEIASLDGEKTLTEDLILGFSTTYSPLYASPDLVRMESGSFIDWIPDDTLALIIHWSSKEADFIAKPPCIQKDYQFARTKFVVFDTILRALSQPAGGSGAIGMSANVFNSGRKSLGDLTIDRRPSGNAIATTSSGVDIETMRYFRQQRDEWWRVTNAGGCIVPGQSLGPAIATRQKNDHNRRDAGRLWENPKNTYYAQPTVNGKNRKPGHNKSRNTFLQRTGQTGSTVAYGDENE